MMLVPFVIDAESLAPDQAWSGTTLRACHHQILDVWARAGLLVHDGVQFEKSSLYRAINHLPPKLKILWLEMAERSPPAPSTNDWDGSVSPERVQDLCSDATLALVDDTRAEVEFGFKEDQDETAFTGIGEKQFVVCRLQAVQQASVVQETYSMSQRNIEAGERYQGIWNSRFRSLASAPGSEFKRIAIVDRYAVAEHFRCPRERLSGLERFLRLLDVDAGGVRYVTLYSAWTDSLKDKSINKNEVETEMDSIARRFQRKNVKRLTVQMVKDQTFGRIAHDRHIRIGRYVWTLGSGVGVFEGQKAERSCEATFKTDTGDYLKREEALERESQTPPIKILC